MRNITFTAAVNEALVWSMERDPKVLFFGLGATDPKRLFGTATGLVEKFGGDRVFDMPTAENGMTGVAIGTSLRGFRPVMTHQRLDFFLLAMDQLVNGAAKWHYMFGGQDHVPITIRLILGRGWGQGPTHSQSLQAWFAHIPGLKVVMPSSPADAKALLISSIFDENPVLFLEHRWLHNQEGSVPETAELQPLGKARMVTTGKDLTLVASSFMTIEALHAVKYLENHGINCDLIDLRTIVPMDWDLIRQSLRKTGRLLVLDTGASSFSVASEIVSWASIHEFQSLKQAPRKLASPDMPVPSSFGLTEAFYITSEDVAREVSSMLGKTLHVEPLKKTQFPHDVPGSWFKGPF